MKKKLPRQINSTAQWRAIGCWVASLSLLLCFSGVHARPTQALGINQVIISLSLKNVPLQQVFSHIEKNSGLTFVYNKSQIDDNRLVSVTITNQSVAYILKLIFEQTPVKFKQLNENIILSVAPAKHNNTPTGTIQGKMYDYETGEALIGATVIVKGTELGSATNVEGEYTIKNVPEGIHTLVFSYIGYTTSTVPDVQVKAGTVTQVNYKLVPANSTLGEIVIRAEVQLENATERSLISEIKNSRNLISGISSEQISRGIDRDAGEVVRRVSGVTLASDRFVVIRGLDPRYTLTLLNDLPTPSSENDRRAFSYDMLNSSTIDRIVVYKTPAPELQGDFAGGVVKVFTKNTANARQLQVQLSGQYRPGSSFTDYYTYKGGKYDRLGLDDGSRNMPKGIPSQKLFPDAESQPVANAEIARQFTQNWNLQRARSTFDKRFLVTYYDFWRMGKGRVNSLTSLTYTLTNDVNEINRQYGFIYKDSLGNLIPGRSVPIERTNDHVSVEGARISAMQNFRWTLSERHKLEFKNFFNLLSRNRTTFRGSRSSSSQGGLEYATYLGRSIQYYFRSRGLYTGLLSGEHQLNRKGNLTLAWRLGYARTNEQQPDWRRFSIERRDTLPDYKKIAEIESDVTPDLPGYYKSRFTSFPNDVKGNNRYYSSLHEDAYTLGVDVEKKFLSDVSLKSGFFGDIRTREFSSRFFTYYYGSMANDLQEKFSTTKPELSFNANQLFAASYFRKDGNGLRIFDYSGVGAEPQYTANNRQYAGYTAINIPLFNKKVNIYGGARMEWNQLKQGDLWRGFLVNLAKDTALDASKTRLYILPSVNISYQVSPKMLLRAAYGKTVNRPEFREIGPASFYDFDKIAYITSNPFLTDAQIQNVDLRWEFYPEEDELLSVGLYYKYFKNPIETISTAAQGFSSDQLQPTNTPECRAYGIEVEARKRLEFVPVPFFRHFSVIANVTLLNTRVILPEGFISGENDLRRRIRPLQGTSPYAVNGGIYYDNTTTNTQASLLYNVIGQRLATVGNSYTAELYEMPRNIIDFSITQRVTRFLRIKAGVQDLLNQPFRIYRDVNRSQKYDPNLLRREATHSNDFQSDYMEETFRPGSYYSFGLLFTW